MAYKNVKNVTLSTDKPQTLYRHIRDFLTATGLYDSSTGVGGWTALYNYESVPGSVSLGDWCCLKTTGESGIWDFRIFIKNTASGIVCFMATGLNNTSSATPTYVTYMGLTSESITLPANWTAFYLYADKDFCAVVVRAGTTNYVHRFGIGVCLYPPAVQPQQLLSAITSGSNKACSVANSNQSGWSAGNRIMFLSWEYAGGGGYTESSNITTNDTGTNTVTVGTNSYAYPAGTYIGQTMPYLVDSTVAKGSTTPMALAPHAGGSESTGYATLNTQLLQAFAYDSLATNIFTGKFVAVRPVFGNVGMSASAWTLPSWHLYTKKRSTEEELHTDGTDTYRYFSFYNETSYCGFLFKEV